MIFIPVILVRPHNDNPIVVHIILSGLRTALDYY